MKLKRCSYGFNLVPTPSYASPYNLGVSPIFQAPVGNTFSPTVYSNKTITRHISTLHFLSSPSAIFRRIVTIIIYAVQRVLRTRLISQICKEIRKTFKRVIPTVADFDSSSTVPLIGSVVRIITTAAHISPRIINRPFVAYCPAMFIPFVSYAFSVISTITRAHRRYYISLCIGIQQASQHEHIGRPA